MNNNLSQEKVDKSENKLPNIIYVMADDMGFGDVEVFNPESKIPTPNMNKLAREGMKFTDAHSSSAVCTPSRYSVLTGRYCWRTELKKWVLFGFGSSLIDSERMTIPSMLKQKGYATAAFGKWHLGDNYPYRPQDRGFQKVVAHKGGGVGQIPDFWGNNYFVFFRPVFNIADSAITTGVALILVFQKRFFKHIK